MKQKLEEKITIADGVSCSLKDGMLECSKGGVSVSWNLKIPGINVNIQGNEIILSCMGNKNEYKIMKSNIAHLKNMFQGLGKKYEYHLESANVHFPMTLKIEKDMVIINNFLGEKVPRKAKILPTVNIDIEGSKIIVSSNSREAAGQTAANLEKATIVKKRDRRVFQDGIYIVEKPRREMK